MERLTGTYVHRSDRFVREPSTAIMLICAELRARLIPKAVDLDHSCLLLSALSSLLLTKSTEPNSRRPEARISGDLELISKQDDNYS
jgi:hypothetical protein